MWKKVLLALLLAISSLAEETNQLLNASYDVAREFYHSYNQLFTVHWQKKSGTAVTIRQSHAGSTKQARAVVDGLDAHVVTMSQPTDIDIIAERGRRLLSKEWRCKFPNNSSPYTSTAAFMVRAGNPKDIKDWNDLTRPEVAVVVPNPKTSGNGRYSYLAMWQFASEQFDGDEVMVKAFLTRIFKNVPVLDTGSRGATTSFVHRGIGDVLLTFEAEILTSIQELGKDKFEIVYPSVSVEAEMPVAVIDRVVDRKGTRALATEYLNYLWSEPAQDLLAAHYYRPRHETSASKAEGRFGKIRLVTVEEKFGGWAIAYKKHFSEGGSFDQVFAARRK